MIYMCVVWRRYGLECLAGDHLSGEAAGLVGVTGVGVLQSSAKRWVLERVWG